MIAYKLARKTRRLCLRKLIKQCQDTVGLPVQVPVALWARASLSYLCGSGLMGQGLFPVGSMHRATFF